MSKPYFKLLLLAMFASFLASCPAQNSTAQAQNSTAPAPTFSPADGTTINNCTVPGTATISDSNGSAKIYYTTDGTTPSTSSTLYSAPIDLSSFHSAGTVTVKAIAVVSGMDDSDVATVTYPVQGGC